MKEIVTYIRKIYDISWLSHAPVVSQWSAIIDREVSLPTYAIGDIQGCREQLERLLETIRFDPAEDQLWLAGDLVNRGPDSLGTLRLLYGIRDQLKIVLGNHDLHMLAAASYPQFASNKDTFTDILDSSDREQLLSWLTTQPLLQESDNYLMTHAGVLPEWSLEQTRRYAEEAESAYQSAAANDYYRGMYGNLPEYWDEDLTGVDRLRFITNVFTRMRYCEADGALKMHYKATIAEAPEGLLPWYDNDRIDWQGKTLLIGHWAALQTRQPRDNLICLDTGCVWGGKLSAYCLETEQWHQVTGVPQ